MSVVEDIHDIEQADYFDKVIHVYHYGIILDTLIIFLAVKLRAAEEGVATRSCETPHHKLESELEKARKWYRHVGAETERQCQELSKGLARNIRGAMIYYHKKRVTELQQTRAHEAAEAYDLAYDTYEASKSRKSSDSTQLGPDAVSRQLSKDMGVLSIDRFLLCHGSIDNNVDGSYSNSSDRSEQIVEAEDSGNESEEFVEKMRRLSTYIELDERGRPMLAPDDDIDEPEENTCFRVEAPANSSHDAVRLQAVASFHAEWLPMDIVPRLHRPP
eukprot:gene30655-38369_t